MADPVKIRSAQYGDLEAVYRFICTLEGTALDFTGFGKIFNNNLRSDRCMYLLAECEGVPVGFISMHIQNLLHHAAAVGEIQELFVASSWRRRGVARKLLAHLDELTRERGIGRIEVTTNIRRTDARAFYCACGFHESHVKFCRDVA